MSDAAVALLTLFERLSARERQEVIEKLEQTEDRHWNRRADAAAAESRRLIPAAEAHRTLRRRLAPMRVT